MQWAEKRHGMFQGRLRLVDTIAYHSVVSKLEASRGSERPQGRETPWDFSGALALGLKSVQTLF